MNKYEQIFFSKYVNEGNEVRYIVHEHIIVILNKIIITLILLVFIPLFFYSESIPLQNLINFKYFEIYLILIYIKIVYDAFDRYNDAWLITNTNIIDLKWALFKIQVNTVNFENIEGIEINQDGFFDKILKKGTLILHKFGEEMIILEQSKIPFVALEEIEKKKKERSDGLGELEKNNFELVLEALTGVVNEYMSLNGIKKQDYNPENLDEVLAKDDTIDLR